MESPRLSVVIPTHNRKTILERCLQALAAQTLPPAAFEVIVVDDGSTDGTPAALAEWGRSLPYALRPLVQANEGPAAARNHGLDAARGTWTLFLGDDILATPVLLEQHLAWHTADPAEALAILGFVTWDPALRITPLMRWLEETGIQFAYHTMRHGDPVPPATLYSCNVSFTSGYLRCHGGFDESFRRAAWEDSELQYRLDKHGLRTRYNADAVAYHHHPTGLVSFTRRSFVAGYEFGRARALHPDRVKPVALPSLGKVRSMRLKVPLVAAFGLLANHLPALARTDRPFWWLLDHYFWAGVRAWEQDTSARGREGEPRDRSWGRAFPSTSSSAGSQTDHQPR
jgi:glycosyltransferase involved in cell wall biosynthesis